MTSVSLTRTRPASGRSNAPATASKAPSTHRVEQVLAYARVQLDLVAAGEHGIAGSVRGMPLTDAARRQFHELHAGLTAPLFDALAGASPDPARWAAYVQGVIDAATTQLESGDEPKAVVAGALRFLRAAQPGSSPIHVARSRNCS